MQYQIDFLQALGFTIFIETVVLFLITQWFDKAIAIKWYLVLLAGIIASMATLPYLWFIAPIFISSKAYYHVFCESFAFAAESLILFAVLKIKFIKALAYSFLCNGVSYTIGLIVF